MRAWVGHYVLRSWCFGRQLADDTRPLLLGTVTRSSCRTETLCGPSSQYASTRPATRSWKKRWAKPLRWRDAASFAKLSELPRRAWPRPPAWERDSRERGGVGLISSPSLVVLLRDREAPVGVGVGIVSLSLPLPLSHAARTSRSMLGCGSIVDSRGTTDGLAHWNRAVRARGYSATAGAVRAADGTTQLQVYTPGEMPLRCARGVRV
jgi:hypothetical protein